MSFRSGRMLAEGGNSSSQIYNVSAVGLFCFQSRHADQWLCLQWFIGRELNPRIGSFDIKSFNELRPGILLWFIIDVSMICKQQVSFGYTTASIWLVTAFHALYIFDSVVNEVCFS